MLHTPLASSKVRNSLFLSFLMSLLTACGGGSDAPASETPANTPNTPSNPGPATVTGVATPDSVAVVTATNAS